MGRVVERLLVRMTACLVLVPFLVAHMAWAAPVDHANPHQHGIGDILLKTAVFEVGSSTLENGLLAVFYGAGIVTPGVLVANVAASGAVYAAHELAWDRLGPADAHGDEPGLIAAKSITYRVASTLRSFAAGYILGGAQVATSTAFALTVAAADSVLYAAVEWGFAWWDTGGSPPDAPR